MKPAEDINDLASDVGVLTVRPRMFGLDDLVSWAGNSVEALRSVSSMFRVDARFQSVSMSSRTDGHPPMGPNGLFIAIRGTQRDGHDFVADAFANGAIAALVDHIPANLEKHVSDGRIVVISANPDRLDHKVRRVGSEVANLPLSQDGPDLPEHVLILVDRETGTMTALQDLAIWWRQSLSTPIVAIAFLSWQLLPIPVLFVIALIWGLINYNRQLGPVAGMLRGQYGQVSARLNEAIQGIEVVKSTAREEFEVARFYEVAKRYRDLFVQEGEIQARYLPALYYGLMIGLSFGYAVWMQSMAVITTAQMIAFLSLVTLFQFPTFISLFMFALVQFGLAGANRILTIINTETEMDENPQGESHQVRGEIEFKDVTFGYADDVCNRCMLLLPSISSYYRLIYFACYAYRYNRRFLKLH
ncbi:MAG: hypothetical protein EB039_02590 [Proteobacteria bacterium]|nr:hypothetical protein [Pseudomonadota bacterium]